jgi:hypothetical protein
MLVLTMALAVAGGCSVFGWRAEAPRPVLLVDAEMHAEDLRDRLAMLAETVEGFDPEAAGRNLHVLSRQHQGGAVRFPDLAEINSPSAKCKAGQDVILEEAQRVRAELVILDNLSTLAELQDENDASAVSPVLSFLMRLKAAHMACILVHHSGKSGESFRGSSKLATTFEAIIGLHKADGQVAAEGSAFEMRWGKVRGARSAATRDMEARLENGPEGTRWVCRPAQTEELGALVDAVRTCQFSTGKDLAAYMQWDPTKVSRLKQRAIAKGFITKAEWDGCMGASGENSLGDF